MRTNGSVYVAVVVALLVAYFSYQWWFNPRRAIKRQLGELAATLSVPADSRGDMDRLARVARLRNYFAPDVQRQAWAPSTARADVARRARRRGGGVEPARGRLERRPSSTCRSRSTRTRRRAPT